MSLPPVKQLSLAIVALFAACCTARGQIVVNATFSATALSPRHDENGGVESFQLNFGANGGTAEAGGQRSSNNASDNQRSSRTFVEFQITSQLKSAAALGTAASLSFNLTGITNGAGGLPALSLILLGSQSSAFNGSSDLSSLWNGSNVWSAPVATGVTAASTGLVGTTVTSSFAGADLTQFLTTVASANVGEYVTFVFYGGARENGAAVTGLSGRDVYEFSSLPANLALSITAIPEPSTSVATVAGVALVFAGWRRRRRAT